MIAELVLGSMFAGVTALLCIAVTFVFIGTVFDEIKRKLRLKEHYKFSFKGSDIGMMIPIILISGGITWIVLWGTITTTRDEVECDLKGGVLNESSQCVKETPL